MSAGRPRKEPERTATSIESVARAWLRLGQAWTRGDERAARAEARLLSDEAKLLAVTFPLELGRATEQQRLRIADERGPRGRAA